MNTLSYPYRETLAIANFFPVGLEIVLAETPIGISAKRDLYWIYPTSELLKLPPQMRRKPPTPSSSRKLPQTPLLMYSADGPGAIPKKNSMPVPEMNYSQALAHPPKLVIPKNPVSKQSKQQTPEDGKGPYQLVSYK